MLILCEILDPGPLPDSQKAPAGFCAHILAALMTFFMTLLMYFRSIPFHINKRLPNVSRQQEQTVASHTLLKEEFRPPSPTSSFRDTEVLSSVLKRLGELEEKVTTLQSKPSEMPHEKEELLNAAVYRVDALEAELIATKKVSSSFYMLRILPLFAIHIMQLSSVGNSDVSIYPAAGSA